MSITLEQFVSTDFSQELSDPKQSGRSWWNVGAMEEGEREDL